MTVSMLGLSSAFTESADACTCAVAKVSSSLVDDVSVTVTSMRWVFSSASCTVNSEGNCVKPPPHSTPMVRADTTERMLASSASVDVVTRRT